MHFARIAKIALASSIATIMTTQAFAVDAAATRALNVRTGPGTGYAVLDTLYHGEVVNVSECDGTGWCFIDHAGPSGWVSARYLTSAVNTVQPPVVAVPPPVVHAPPPTYSQSDDVAGALAFAAILGIGAVMIGSAIANSNDQPSHNPPNQPHRPNGSRGCPPGSIWSWNQHTCVAH